MSPDIDNDTSYPLQTVIADTDQFVLIDKTAGTLEKSAWSVLKSTLKTYMDTLYFALGGTRYFRGFISNPQAVYASRAQVLIAITDAAITITKIEVRGNDPTPTAELAGDLKFADDTFTGGLANPVVIDVLDTTNGTFTATSFDDATVPSGKHIYFQFDASPHADWHDVFLQISYTVD